MAKAGSASTEAEDAVIGGDARFNQLMRRLCAYGVEGGGAHPQHSFLKQAEWQEVLTFLRENIMTEERIMKEYRCGYEAGSENAAKTIQRKLAERASALFIANKDTEAKDMRALAKEVDTWMAK